MSQNQPINSNINTDYVYSSNIQQLTDKFNNEIKQSHIQLNQLLSDMNMFSKDTEITLKTEELELTKLQNSLLQLKYELLNHTCESLEADNLSMRNKIDTYTCSICLTNSKDCILEPCGHFVCCIPCIGMIPNAQCPVCRTVCNYYIRVFNS